MITWTKHVPDDGMWTTYVGKKDDRKVAYIVVGCIHIILEVYDFESGKTISNEWFQNNVEIEEIKLKAENLLKNVVEKMKTKPDYKIVFEKYSDLWNRNLAQLQSDFEKDKTEFPNDDAICLKWTHLLNQEIWMWISLCCGEEVEYSQVPLNDFNFIVERRGFTPRITNILRDFLVDIGIGDELKSKVQ